MITNGLWARLVVNSPSVVADALLALYIYSFWIWLPHSSAPTLYGISLPNIHPCATQTDRNVWYNRNERCLGEKWKQMKWLCVCRHVHMHMYVHDCVPMGVQVHSATEWTHPPSTVILEPHLLLTFFIPISIYYGVFGVSPITPLVPGPSVRILETDLVLRI